MDNRGQGEPVIRLRTFGATLIEGPNGPIEGLGAKALGLLVYLALRAPQPVTRDAIVELLWERVSAAQGKGSLRQELRRFKKQFGEDLFDDALQVTDLHVSFRPGAVEIDAQALESAAASDSPEDQARILELFAGDFLEDNGAKAVPFQDWLSGRANFYKDIAIRALTQLAETDLAEGRLDRARQAAERVVRLDPLHDPAHMALIAAHMADGGNGQARNAYEAFRTIYLREHGKEPEISLSDISAPAVAKPPVKAAEQKEERANGETRSKPLIAVVNVSPRRGGDQEYLAAGVVEELVANLSRSNWIKVSALGAPVVPRDVMVDQTERELRGNVDYVLRVNVQIAGERASIISTLNRIEDSETLFSDSMHADANDILQLQRDVAIRIANIFEVKTLDAEGEQLRDMDWGGPVDMDHWKLLMRARWLFWRTGPKSNAEAQRCLNRALKLQPDDAPTLCLAAFTNMLDGWCDWSEDVVGSFSMAREFAKRAVKVQPNSAWAQFTLGTASSTIASLTEAKTRVEHALTLSPTFVSATGDLARINVFMGDTKVGAAQADEAMSLSPFDPHYGLFIRTRALAHYMNDELDKAQELIDYALVVRPGWFMNYFLKAAILSDMGKERQAAEAYGDGAQMLQGYSDDAFMAGHPFRNDADMARFASALNKVGGSFLN
ncbi:MAG: BTAD domain-containing putative transcriptional regulator [Pseudomonadota bacterium]